MRQTYFDLFHSRKILQHLQIFKQNGLNFKETRKVSLIQVKLGIDLINLPTPNELYNERMSLAVPKLHALEC